MNKQDKERIRKFVGEGKLYEVEISYDEISLILTKEKDFNFGNVFSFTFLADVTNETDSLFVKEIHNIFGENIKVLAYSDYYSNYGIDKYHIFKKIEGYDRINNIPTTNYVVDVNCHYIVCTTNKNTKLKKFNTEFLDNIKIDYE